MKASNEENCSVTSRRVRKTFICDIFSLVILLSISHSTGSSVAFSIINRTITISQPTTLRTWWFVLFPHSLPFKDRDKSTWKISTTTRWPPQRFETLKCKSNLWREYQPRNKVYGGKDTYSMMMHNPFTMQYDNFQDILIHSQNENQMMMNPCWPCIWPFPLKNGIKNVLPHLLSSQETAMIIMSEQIDYHRGISSWKMSNCYSNKKHHKEKTTTTCKKKESIRQHAPSIIIFDHVTFSAQHRLLDTAGWCTKGWPEIWSQQN